MQLINILFKQQTINWTIFIQSETIINSIPITIFFNRYLNTKLPPVLPVSLKNILILTIIYINTSFFSKTNIEILLDLQAYISNPRSHTRSTH